MMCVYMRMMCDVLHLMDSVDHNDVPQGGVLLLNRAAVHFHLVGCPSSRSNPIGVNFVDLIRLWTFDHRLEQILRQICANVKS